MNEFVNAWELIPVDKLKELAAEGVLQHNEDATEWVVCSGLLLAIEKVSALQAEIARFNAWADGFSDAQLKERAACEEVIRELRAQVAELTSKNNWTMAQRDRAEERLEASAVTSQTVDRELSSSADGRGYSRDDEDWFFSPNDGD